jgi:hypothetical protein
MVGSLNLKSHETTAATMKIITAFKHVARLNMESAVFSAAVASGGVITTMRIKRKRDRN